MFNTYQHTIVSNREPNARPLFQSYNLMPSNTQKRYYSSTDVSIFFGDLYIEEAATLVYEVSESAMLLYGYNSYVFDDVAKGSRMIQGRFSIQFIHSGYLFKILNELVELESASKIVHSNRAALWPLGFDLFVKHGGSKFIASDLQIVSLENVYLTGCTTQYDSKSGEPIQEMYSFIAQDINYGFKNKETIFEETPLENTSKDLDIFSCVYNKTSKKMSLQLNQSITIRSGQYIIQGEYFTGLITYKEPVTTDIIDFTVASKIQAYIESGKTNLMLNLDYQDPTSTEEKWITDHFNLVINNK